MAAFGYIRLFVCIGKCILMLMVGSAAYQTARMHQLVPDCNLLQLQETTYKARFEITVS